MGSILSKFTVSWPLLVGLPLLMFILGAISKPFFSELGKDLYAWSKRHFAKPKLKADSPPKVIPTNTLTSTIPVAPQEPKSVPISSRADNRGIERIARLTFQEVREAFDRAPPLQKHLQSEQYEGLRVKWEGIFTSATSRASGVRVYMEADGIWPNRVAFTVALDDYPELKILHAGRKLRVIGSIKNVDDLVVELSEVDLVFLE